MSSVVDTVACRSLVSCYEGERAKSSTVFPVELARCQLIVSPEQDQVPDPPCTGLFLPEIGAPPFTLKVTFPVISPTVRGPEVAVVDWEYVRVFESVPGKSELSQGFHSSEVNVGLVAGHGVVDAGPARNGLPIGSYGPVGSGPLADEARHVVGGGD